MGGQELNQSLKRHWALRVTFDLHPWESREEDPPPPAASSTHSPRDSPCGGGGQLPLPREGSLAKVVWGRGAREISGHPSE